MFKILEVNKEEKGYSINFHLSRKFEPLLYETHKVLSYDSKAEKGKVFIQAELGEEKAYYRAKIILKKVLFINTLTTINLGVLKRLTDDSHGIWAEYQKEEDSQLVEYFETLLQRLEEIIAELGSIEALKTLREEK